MPQDRRGGRSLGTPHPPTLAGVVGRSPTLAWRLQAGTHHLLDVCVLTDSTVGSVSLDLERSSR